MQYLMLPFSIPRTGYSVLVVPLEETLQRRVFLVKDSGFTQFVTQLRAERRGKRAMRRLGNTSLEERRLK